MIVNWYFLVGGLIAIFCPARWLTGSDCRYLEFWQIKAMRIDKNKRRRRWWKARHVWLEPLRGAAGAWALKEGIVRAGDATGLLGLLPSIIVLAALGLSIFVQVLARRKKARSRRKRPDDTDTYDNAEENGDESEKSMEADGYKSSDSRDERKGTLHAGKPVNAPLLFMGGVILGLLHPFVAVPVVLMGIIGLLAFHHWGIACLVAAVTMAVIGYLIMKRSIYVPGVAVLLMEPALLAWYLQRPLVVPVRI